MALHELSDREVRNAKPAEKEYLLADGGGLFLRVCPSGAKDWVFVYTFAGNRRKLGLGSLESVPLAAARSEAAKARERSADVAAIVSRAVAQRAAPLPNAAPLAARKCRRVIMRRLSGVASSITARSSPVRPGPRAPSW